MKADRRLARVFQNPRVVLVLDFGEIRERRALRMLTIEGLLTILSFGLGCFVAGYTFGKDSDRGNSVKK